MEFRRPMFSCNSKLFQSSGGRSISSNCTPNSGVTSEHGEFTSQKITAESRKRNAEAWPNRLTSTDQVSIIQNFCTHFYERYCTAFGDLQGSTHVTSCRNEAGKERADNSKVHPAPSDQISTVDNTYAHESRGALCPFFFIGSLSDAAKLCERPCGRPWPVVLFYLHHEQSNYTRRFVENVLCSNTEDIEASSCEPGNRTPTIPDLIVPGQYSSASEKVEAESFSQPNGAQSAAQRVVASKPSQQSELYRGRLCRRRMSENLDSGRRNASLRNLTRTVRSSTASPELQVASLKRRFNDPSLRPLGSGKNSASNDSVGRVGQKHKSFTSGSQSKDKQTNNASRSLLFPHRTTSIEAEELSGTELIRREVATQPERKLEYVCAASHENDQVYETSYRTKSFRTLLLERSAGLVPWDCTTVTARAHLASAFAGTQLAQWLKEWSEPNQYPLLVAIGRTAERDVVCSYLSGPKSNRVSALKWLNEVTLAHFSNYLNKTVPLCPERSERLTGTTTSSAENTPNVQNQIPTQICSYLPGGASFTVSRTTAITGELTEHTFTSLLSTRGPSNDRGVLTRSNCTKYSASSNFSEEVIYRVGKTPKQEERTLSSLFVSFGEQRLDELRDQLKGVQTSFSQAVQILSKCTTAKYLHSIGIPVEFLALKNTVGFLKALSTQQLTTALCMVSDPITESQLISIPTLEARPHPSHYLMPSLGHDSQTSGRSRINPITRERKLSPRVSTRSFSKPSSTDSQKCDSLREDPQFYHEFRRDFVKAFPSSPPFLLGHFQTALMRSFDIPSNQQTSPLLVYLHDGHSPGIFHFVANVLCSRRFTSRLFDHNLQLWPLDVSGVADGSYSLLRGNSDELFDCVQRIRDVHVSEQKQSSQTSTGKTKKRCKIQSLSGFPTGLLGGSGPSTTARKLKKEGSSEMWMASSNNTHHLLEFAAPNSNESTKQTNALASAERLLQFFYGHPAEVTIKRLFKVPVLPTIVNVFYSEKKFSITHILLPSSTTKNSLSWLNSVIKFYHRSRSKR
ncbi:hypothetical protein CRM22_007692 [Opisthorchis felineus]|nr:hypothetical protein CRM22_007692 [Opisthorchis felineus]